MKKLYRNDFLLNIFIIALCIVFPLYLFLSDTDSHKTVIISYNGSVEKELSLNEDASYSCHGVDVTVKNGKAFVAHSDCPDGLCMKMKKAGNSGDSIICVPNKVSVIIRSDDGKAGADVVVG